MASARVHRWQLIISSYQCEIKYRKGSSNSNADGLSRLQIVDVSDNEEEEPIMINSFTEVTDINFEDVRKFVSKSRTLRELKSYVINGWPINSHKLSEEMKFYYNVKEALSHEDGCIYYGFRILIPKEMIYNVLKMLHDTHIGIVRMKQLARTYVWWKNIDRDVENFVQSCKVCSHSLNNKSSTLVPWYQTHSFFERIHLDFFYFAQFNVLLLVDTYSKWIELEVMQSTTADKVLQFLDKIITTFGLPKSICTDNGPQFSAFKFIDFCKRHGIEVQKSPPYHPESNGIAERAVQTVKKTLKKFLLDKNLRGLSFQDKINKFLFKYRNTSCSSTNAAPAERVFSFTPRTPLDFVNPICKTFNNVNNSLSLPPSNKKSNIKFAVGQKVLYRNVNSKSCNWMEATIFKILSPQRYVIFYNGRYCHVHFNHLRNFVRREKHLVFKKNFRKRTKENYHHEVPHKYLAISRRPKRNVKKPDRLTYE